MATLRELAQRAGVSVATVSRALNNSGYVRAEVRERILQIARELNYTPSALAVGLRKQRTGLVLLLVPDITNPFFSAMARGVEDVLGAHGLQVILGNSDDQYFKERQHLHRALSKGVDGVIAVVASSVQVDTGHWRNLKVPVVLLDRPSEHVAADVVTCDNEEGAYQVGRHLLSLGHQTLAVISGPLRLRTSQDRLAGVQRAIQEFRLPREHVIVAEENFREDGGYHAMQALLRRVPRPTAVFACNDLMALGALAALEEAGLRVPEDVAVAGYDDIPYAARIKPRLTTVAQPKYEMGVAAAELLLRRLRNPNLPYEEVVLRPSLVIRDSTLVKEVVRNVMPGGDARASGSEQSRKRAPQAASWSSGPC